MTASNVEASFLQVAYEFANCLQLCTCFAIDVLTVDRSHRCLPGPVGNLSQEGAQRAASECLKFISGYHLDRECRHQRSWQAEEAVLLMCALEHDLPNSGRQAAPGVLRGWRGREEVQGE